MRTTVANCRAKGFEYREGDVPIGRPGPWGNLYSIGRDGSREDVVRKHREDVLNDPELQRKIKEELKGKRLICFCHPKPCHGHVYAEIADGRPLPESLL